MYIIYFFFEIAGLPSPAVILNVSGGLGSANITLRVDSFGVLVASDFTFVVSVFSQADTTNLVVMRMITPDSILSPIVAIVAEGLSEGNYSFSIISHNIFSPLLNSTHTSSQVFVKESQSLSK